MEIQKFIEDTSKGSIPLATLTTIASDRSAFGPDAIAAFASQAQQRSAAAQAVLTEAEKANRDTLLASEQRAYDAAIRERDAILGLQRHVEQRTEQRAHVPATQITAAHTTSVVLTSPVLGREQRAVDFVRARGGRYVGEPGAEHMRCGSVIRAFITGNRDGLSDLERRALSEGTDSAGGYTVPEVLGAQWIDRVRNAATVFRAGAQTVPMTSDTLHLARLAQPGIYTDGSPGGPAAVWKVESAPIEEGTLTLERVTFTARTLPILVKLSVELGEDSQNIDALLERELTAAFALELDRVALFGNGVAPEPKGIRYQTSVHVEDLNGVGVTDYDFIIDSIARLWANNHNPNARIMPPSLVAALAKLKDNTGQPLRAPDVVTAVPQFVTNQIENVGGSPSSTTMFVGDFSQLLIGMRTSFRMEVSRTAGEAFENLQVWVRAYLRADVQLAHPEAFDVIEDIG